jgi:hypothetical protein
MNKFPTYNEVWFASHPKQTITFVKDRSTYNKKQGDSVTGWAIDKGTRGDGVAIFDFYPEDGSDKLRNVTYRCVGLADEQIVPEIPYGELVEEEEDDDGASNWAYNGFSGEV